MANNQKSALSQSEHDLNIKVIGINQNHINNKNLKKIKQACHSAMKDPKDSIDDHDQGELPSRFPSWPPRSYTCSFCKKEFRSAQALGGHMNIHRIDRAKLRLYYPLRAAISSPYSSTSTTRIMRWQKSVEMTKKKTTIHQDVGSLKPKKSSSSVAMTAKNVKVDAKDLQIGEQKQDLDLELRLGYT